jgi:pyruvate dehydrogenase E1 component
MTNLGGHDLETILDAFEAADASDAPHCFVAYTIKGYGLPLQGHKDNHAGLMNPTQLAQFQRLCKVPQGQEWEPLAGLTNPAAVQAILRRAPLLRRPPAQSAAVVKVDSIAPPAGDELSTQEAFGKILFELARERTALSQRLVTTSPDVTVSTNLSGWVNRRGVFHSSERADTFHDEKIASPQRWRMGPGGQHIELGIAENNLFLMLGQLGLADRFWGERLLPIGTVYDPFINRGLDAMIYACYQGARFMIVATPSGITLAAEGGAHQSINTPLIGIAQDGLSSFEPAYADELALIMTWAFDHMQADDGGSVYLRLTTRSIEQLPRILSVDQQRGVIAGAYWLRRPSPNATLAIAYAGAVAPEAHAAVQGLLERNPGIGVLSVTSPDRLYCGWQAAQRQRQTGRLNASSAIEDLLDSLAPDATIVSVLDGHPAALSWLGAVYGHPIQALGVERFGQSADLQDLYALNRIDAPAIVAAARAPRRRPHRGMDHP